MLRKGPEQPMSWEGFRGKDGELGHFELLSCKMGPWALGEVGGGLVNEASEKVMGEGDRGEEKRQVCAGG